MRSSNGPVYGGYAVRACRACRGHASLEEGKDARENGPPKGS